MSKEPIIKALDVKKYLSFFLCSSIFFETFEGDSISSFIRHKVKNVEIIGFPELSLMM